MSSRKPEGPVVAGAPTIHAAPRYAFLIKYGLTCVAASVAESVTYPLDLTKTRLQIQGEASDGAIRRGMFGTAIGVVREEGVLALWSGLSPAVLRHVVYTGSRMTFYEALREHVFKRDASNPNERLGPGRAVLCGGMAGAAGQLLASPFDLVKVQMQMAAKKALKEGNIGPKLGTFSTLAKLSRGPQSYLGLWRGWVPNVQRAALVNMGDLATYDTVKHWLIDSAGFSDTPVVHAIGSVCSGLVAATCSTPMDVAKTRIMNQSTLDKAVYRSTWHCLSTTVQNEGFFALYKGFVPIWIRMAPWSLTFWLSFEQIRKFAGLPSF